MEPFRNLFQPIQIGKLELKNRIVMLAMTTGYGELNETVSDRLVTFFAERAKGGAGLMIVPFGPRAGSPVEPGLYDDRFIPGATRLTERIHAFGAKIAGGLADYLLSCDIRFRASPKWLAHRRSGIR